MTSKIKTDFVFPVNLFQLKRAMDMGFTNIEAFNTLEEKYLPTTWDFILKAITLQSPVVETKFENNCIRTYKSIL